MKRNDIVKIKHPYYQVYRELYPFRMGSNIGRVVRQDKNNYLILFTKSVHLWISKDMVEQAEKRTLYKEV